MTHMKSICLSLRLRLLWLRHSFTFRWAHGPLCDRFSSDILRIGRIHLCRSCVCVYCGLLMCATLCAYLSAIAEHAMLLLLCIVTPTVLFSAPRLYKLCPRPFRDVLRFCMGCCISLCVCAMLAGHIFAAVACGSVLFAFWRIYFVARRKRKAEACKGCADIGQNRICTGCRVQAAGIRAYETEATRILASSGLIPASSRK